MYTYFIDQLNENYKRVFNYTGGHPDLRTVALMAMQYTFANKVYSGVEQQAIIDQLYERSAIFSLRSYGDASTLNYKIAGQLLLNGQSVEEQLVILKKKDDILAHCGFTKTSYRVLSAFFLEDTAHAVRAKNLYDEMHKYHPFLTRKSDFPCAVLLTLSNDKDVAVRAKTMNEYFIKLREQGFKTGDYLQTLTQMMTIFNERYNEELVQYVKKLYDVLIEHGVKVKKMHYPYIGLLALTATDSNMVKNIATLEEQLRQTEALKSVKELALVVAIQKLIQDYVEAQDVITSSYFTHWSDLFQMADCLLYLDSGLIVGLPDLFDFKFDF